MNHTINKNQRPLNQTSSTKTQNLYGPTTEEKQEFLKFKHSVKKQLDSHALALNILSRELQELRSANDQLIKGHEEEIKSLTYELQKLKDEMKDQQDGRDFDILNTRIDRLETSANTVRHIEVTAHSKPTRTRRSNPGLRFKVQIDNSLDIRKVLAGALFGNSFLDSTTPLSPVRIASGTKFNTYFVEFQQNSAGVSIKKLRQLIGNFDWDTTTSFPTKLKSWYGPPPSLNHASTSERLSCASSTIYYSQED